MDMVNALGKTHCQIMPSLPVVAAESGVMDCNREEEPPTLVFGQVDSETYETHLNYVRKTYYFQEQIKQVLKAR